MDVAGACSAGTFWICLDGKGEPQEVGACIGIEESGKCFAAGDERVADNPAVPLGPILSAKPSTRRRRLASVNSNSPGDHSWSWNEG
jgi:hypothetical protein